VQSPQWQFSISKALPVEFISAAYSVMLHMLPQPSNFTPYARWRSHKHRHTQSALDTARD
jgi:hypothetical protein